MQRHRDRRRGAPGSRVPQSDLFASPRVASGPAGAVWLALPAGTRRSLTDLLARLLLEHGANVRRAGGRHER
jgi:hypothetical protein